MRDAVVRDRMNTVVLVAGYGAIESIHLNVCDVGCCVAALAILASEFQVQSGISWLQHGRNIPEVLKNLQKKFNRFVSVDLGTCSWREPWSSEKDQSTMVMVAW